jgi:HJR/Mrr/RecB family endonuclease
MPYNLIIFIYFTQKGLKVYITKKIEDVGQIGLKEGSIDVF